MRRKIFLDVGGHEGQTLNEVLSGKYSFDKVYCFEPMPREYNFLVENFSSIGEPYGLEILNYGLLDTTGERIIYGTNEDMAASIYKEKRDVGNRHNETLCKFVSSSEFFEEHINDEDLVIMKLNCEGSEIMIANSLLDSGEIKKVDNMMLDFDIKKVPGKEQEADELIDRLNVSNFKGYSLVGDVMIGNTHESRIGNWLSTLPFYTEILKS
jgi:FkbM family methyltransferase